ncbi:MAG: bifunctional 2-C-methyl-D-erythritol 4-phosphate cytidylyltransferase/2-C-methyl-D-erythritol 2,4-cyclodiphosphate synthase [Rhodospirillales bacterium]|nr:bifunctional 2-C-methyl-D-erythritol 4-phosphate cytidylyltransferase/2-C-methyl-D-erythritol 2,4-cyclodiphosphate synthase [Rhodospirillales bacterium]MCB9995661.1 bifunctional 2-C-methyl-D-erythritol 4-phosphate cytidylyltransferase/2-C-methyl-D-erythritol 2,4-cyclodiphosphate synthase [Rhodospirillales bacterium]
MEISASSKQVVPFYAVIVAAGSGTRLGGETPKQYQKISGKAILRHTLERFLSSPGLQEIRVVINPDHRTLYNEAVQGLDLPEPISGGKDRNNSVFNGINSFSNPKNNDTILIHDAARPLVSADEIIALVQKAAETGAATLASPVTDTQKYDGGAYVDRGNLWAIQTPQGFHYDLLLRAHQAAGETNASCTDDTGLVAATGKEIAFVPGSRQNIKITTPEDMDMAQKLLGPSPQTDIRTGFGYDVHAFTEGNVVRLCGVDIPHTHKLKGHSDADVGLHALTDALLGTIGAGDIGTYFPPSAPQWKDVDSAVFLQKAVEMIREKGGTINNVDLTLICEAPKIGPHREAMQQKIAQICGLETDRIGLKATTNEKLGFLGREEGIAAHAVATVRFTPC